MKNFDKKELDEIFRNGLLVPDLDEVNEDWELMKARLQQRKGRSRFGYYMWFASSVAAALLMIFAVNFYTGQPDTVVQSHKASNQNVQKPAISTSQNKVSENVKTKISDLEAESQKLVDNSSGAVVPPGAFRTQDIHYTPQISTVDAAMTSVNDELSAGNPTAAAINGVLDSQPVAEVVQSSPDSALVSRTESVIAADPVQANSQDPDKKPSAKSRLSLALTFAPDFNGVEHFSRNKVNYSVGAGLIFQVNKKLFLEAGAAYGKKTYQTVYSSFKPNSSYIFAVMPNAVRSGFDVMDIQLNMAYNLFSKGKYSIGVGTGLSSYLMLNEQYSFTYQNVNARGLSSFKTGYQRNHFFGIANLNLSFKRSLSGNVKLAFNPYLKLPLTDLGYGNIRLRSAGISVGVITNLNKAK